MTDLPRAIVLSCKNCGAALEIQGGHTEVACGHCGTTHFVERAGGAVSLQQIGESIAEVQAGTSRTAAELAIRRYKEEIEQLEADLGERLKARTVKGSHFTMLAALAVVCLMLLAGLAGYGVGAVLGLSDPMMLAVVLLVATGCLSLRPVERMRRQYERSVVVDVSDIEDRMQSVKSRLRRSLEVADGKGV